MKVCWNCGVLLKGRPCSAEGCKKLHHAHGLCFTHYMRAYQQYMRKEYKSAVMQGEKQKKGSLARNTASAMGKKKKVKNVYTD